MGLVWQNMAKYWLCEHGGYKLAASSSNWSAIYKGENIGKGGCLGVAEGKEKAAQAYREHFKSLVPR
jgi:hypothetical protein